MFRSTKLQTNGVQTTTPPPSPNPHKCHLVPYGIYFFWTSSYRRRALLSIAARDRSETERTGGWRYRREAAGRRGSRFLLSATGNKATGQSEVEDDAAAAAAADACPDPASLEGVVGVEDFVDLSGGRGACLKRVDEPGIEDDGNPAKGSKVRAGIEKQKTQITKGNHLILPAPRPLTASLALPTRCDVGALL